MSLTEITKTIMKCKNCESENILVVNDDVEFYVNEVHVNVPIEYSLCSDCKTEFVTDTQFTENITKFLDVDVKTM